MGVVDRAGPIGEPVHNHKLKKGTGMESWAIFKHAARMIFGNFGNTLRVTGALYIVGFALPLILFGHNHAFFPASVSVKTDFTITTFFTTSLSIDGRQIDWRVGLFNFVLSWLCTIWICVVWHRYVLLKEKSRVIPIFYGKEIGYFFGALLMVGLIGWILMAIWGLIVFKIIEAFGLFPDMSMFRANPMLFAAVGTVLTAIVYAPSAVATLRLSVLFPMAAMGRFGSVNSALYYTEGANRVMFGVVALAAVLLWIVSVLSMEAAEFVSKIPYLGIVPAAIMGWTEVVVIAAIVTTIYQLYVGENLKEVA